MEGGSLVERRTLDATPSPNESSVFNYTHHTAQDLGSTEALSPKSTDSSKAQTKRVIDDIEVDRQNEIFSEGHSLIRWMFADADQIRVPQSRFKSPMDFRGEWRREIQRPPQLEPLQ